jgi:hypothetical protein
MAQKEPSICAVAVDFKADVHLTELKGYIDDVDLGDCVNFHAQDLLVFVSKDRFSVGSNGARQHARPAAVTVVDGGSSGYSYMWAVHFTDSMEGPLYYDVARGGKTARYDLEEGVWNLCSDARGAPDNACLERAANKLGDIQGRIISDPPRRLLEVCLDLIGSRRSSAGLETSAVIDGDLAAHQQEAMFPSLSAWIAVAALISVVGLVVRRLRGAEKGRPGIR